MIAHGLDPELLDELASYRADNEMLDTWPGEQLELLADYGVMADVIPRAYGGTDEPGDRLLARYVALAEACLETTFLLTQRNGACQRIAASDNEDLKRAVLPELATGERFTTVGISHLTTSRQHLGRPAVVAEPCDDGWQLRGRAPWVSGAQHADWIVTGGVATDGQQVLALVRTESALVQIEPSADLLGFTSSETASVALNGNTVAALDILAGPSPRVLLEVKVGGTGSLTTSALAVGATAASIAGIRREAQARPELEASLRRLDQQCKRLKQKLFGAARGSTDGPGESFRLRAEANSLAMRAATAWLAASKGSGYITGHPAERAVREAMFFLVWSCPRSVVMQAMTQLSVPPTTMM